MYKCHPEEKDCPVSKCAKYGELKKAFAEVRKNVNDKLGKESFKEEPIGRSKRIRYIGANKDPLADMKNARVIKDIKEYWSFCQESAGIFPISWLEYFFRGTRDLVDINSRRRKGEQVISTSLDRTLTNIELLPQLYDWIIKKQVLSITYKPYDKEPKTLIFHPHYLKEFNGRWFLFGYAAEGLPPYKVYNLSIDRIEGKPSKINREYVPAPAGFYKEYFNNIVGVTHLQEPKTFEITLRAHTHYMFKLMETKRIHHTQHTSHPFGEHGDESYGEFHLEVEINNEFFGRILQMGEDLEIVSPEEVRREFKKRVQAISKLYE